MNTYELEIHVDQRFLGKQKPYHFHIDCDENSLKEHLAKISTQGILVDTGQDRRYIPSDKINFIDVKFLEKIQDIPDVSETIKSVLKEE